MLYTDYFLKKTVKKQPNRANVTYFVKEIKKRRVSTSVLVNPVSIRNFFSQSIGGAKRINFVSVSDGPSAHSATPDPKM